jgi:nucleoside-diphosphate-sugar epimerase
MIRRERYVVMGGAGMLGREIVRQLLGRGHAVRVLDLEPLEGGLCETIVGDIRDQRVVEQACRGVDVVIQTAAAVWNVRTPRTLYEEVNVDGNRAVIDACLQLGVPRLVYTSSMDVVVDGRKPIVDGDESLPYPSTMPRDAYSKSKIVAEKMVLAANGPRLCTCVLRPVGMYGPRDKYHLGNIIGMARRGVSLRLGNGKARFSHAYSENVAHAHVLAADLLLPGSPVCGQSYFICDHYPAENLFDFMEPFLRALDLPVPHRSVPYRLAYALSAVAEVFAPHSNFNRFAVIQTCVDHTFVDDKARRDLGYVPVVSREEAFQRSIAWLRRDEAAAAWLTPGSRGARTLSAR